MGLFEAFTMRTKDFYLICLFKCVRLDELELNKYPVF